MSYRCNAFGLGPEWPEKCFEWHSREAIFVRQHTYFREGLLEFVLKAVTMVGAHLQESIEGWVLLLFAGVIALDMYFGRKDKLLFIAGVVQVLGLAYGYVWVLGVFADHDVSGPWAWGLVVGSWLILVVIFHLWYGLRQMMSRA